MMIPMESDTLRCTGSGSSHFAGNLAVGSIKASLAVRLRSYTKYIKIEKLSGGLLVLLVQGTAIHSSAKRSAFQFKSSVLY